MIEKSNKIVRKRDKEMLGAQTLILSTPENKNHSILAA